MPLSGLIVTLNAGSSNCKVAAIDATTLRERARAQCASIAAAMEWMHQLDETQVAALSTRVVHGANRFTEPTHVTPEFLTTLRELIPLAPLHLPQSIELMETASAHFPHIPHIACFDTAFHHTLPQAQRLFAIPLSWAERGVMRYGFHGLSYEWVAQQLPQLAGHMPPRVLALHLGNGASACAMREGKSVATSMGFSTIDGLMMGTRSGAIDPGVLLYLQQQCGLNVAQVEELLTRKSGLLGVSGVSNDVSVLEKSAAPQAALALELFCQFAAQHACGLLAALGGLDALVFTGGIGEHCAHIRRRICDQLGFLGVALHESANQANEAALHQEGSRVQIWKITANEEFILAQHAHKIL